MDLKATGIYLITSVDNHAYVGMTSTSFKQRFNQHLSKLKSNVVSHHCFYLQNLYNVHGESYLQFKILETIAVSSENINSFYSQLLAREVYWWDTLKSQGYTMLNSRPSGTGSVIHDDETKKKISASLASRYKNIALIEKNIEEIKVLAADERVSIKEIADTYGISFTSLKTYLNTNKISSKFKKKPVAWEDYPILEWIKEEKLSTRKIAKRIGCSQPAVVNYLKGLRKNVTF